MGAQHSLTDLPRADTTLNYFTTIPVSEAKIWTLKTAGPNTLYATGYFDQVTGKNEMMLALNGSDITISTVAGSTWPIAPEDASSFNRAKLLQNRKIFLSIAILIPLMVIHTIVLILLLSVTGCVMV